MLPGWLPHWVRLFWRCACGGAIEFRRASARWRGRQTGPLFGPRLCLNPFAYASTQAQVSGPWPCLARRSSASSADLRC